MKIISIERSLHNVYMGYYEIMSKIDSFEIAAHKQSNLNDISKRLNTKINILEEKYFFSKEYGFYYSNLYSFLKKKNYDLILCRTYFSYNSLICLIYSLLNKKKVVFIEEQNQNPRNIFLTVFFVIYSFILRLVLNLNKIKIIAVTSMSYNYLKKKGFKYVHKIDLPYTVNEEITKISYDKDKLKIISVARFEWLKAQHILVEAINYLVKNKLILEKEISVEIIGEGSLKPQIIKLVENYGLNEIFNFSDNISKKELYLEYKKNNLFILSSRMEMIGAVVYEAMENSLPVIVSDSVGSKDAIIEGKNGYIFKNLNPVDLANKILKFHKLKNKKQLSINSYNQLKKKYDKEEIFKRIVKIIK